MPSGKPTLISLRSIALRVRRRDDKEFIALHRPPQLENAHNVAPRSDLSGITADRRVRAGQDTERSRILDIAGDAPWPECYPARTIRNAFLERWRDREQDLEADDEGKAAFQVAAADGDLSVIPVWASEAIDLITSLSPAVDLVAQLSREAEAALIHAGEAVTPTGAPR
jgi:hypothetical protein